MKKIIAILFLFLAAVAVLFVLLSSSRNENRQAEVSNFEECAAAGFPVMESYPRQCTVPNGNFFVEVVVLER